MHRLMAAHAPEVNAIDITMAQTKALYVVFASGSLRMSELAARLGVTSSTATGLVDRLVELDLLSRRDDAADRRQVVVTTTSKAEASMEHFRELNARRMRELLGRVSADDLVAIERSIVALGSALDAEAVSDATTTPSTTTPTTAHRRQGDRS